MVERSQQTPSEAAMQDARISPLAAASLLLALASVAGCIIIGVLAFFIGPWLAAGIIAMPLLALAAVGMGLLAVRRIRRSGGALRGQGFAVAGLFVGLMSAVIQGSASFAAVGSWRSVQMTLAPAVDQFIKDAAAGKRDPARHSLAESTSAALTDERFDAFFALILARFGEPRGAGVSLDVFWRASAAVRGAPAAATAPIQQDKVAPYPVELACANGKPLCYVFLDAVSLQQKQVRIVDLLVLLPNGESMTLLPAGPAMDTAAALGFRNVN